MTCLKPRGTMWRTCIHYMADGWIDPSDLCGPCTVAFMAALDSAAGEPLPWHQNYRDRAERAGSVTG